MNHLDEAIIKTSGGSINHTHPMQPIHTNKEICVNTPSGQRLRDARLIWQRGINKERPDQQEPEKYPVINIYDEEGNLKESV